MSRFFQRRNHETAHNDPVGNGSSCRPNFRSPDEHVGQIDHIDSQGEKAQEEQENNRLRVADNDPPEFDYPEVDLTGLTTSRGSSPAIARRPTALSFLVFSSMPTMEHAVSDRPYSPPLDESQIETI